MKYLLMFSLIFVLVGCNHDNTTSPIELLPKDYLGAPNTTREYESYSWMFKASSDSPYVYVPDSLINRLTFDSSSIREGLVSFSKHQQVVIPRDPSFNQLTYYNPKINYYQMKNISIEQRNLEDELYFISIGIPYSGSGGGTGIDGSLWVETSDSMYIQFNDTSKYIFLKKPLEIGSNWVREQHQYRAQTGGYQTFQQECTVLSNEEVNIAAGKFRAYKIEVVNHWVDLNYKSVRHYEYYVPNVGLILSESDSNVYRTIFSNGGSYTIYFRQKERTELINYNFINQ